MRSFFILMVLFVFELNSYAVCGQDVLEADTVVESTGQSELPESQTTPPVYVDSLDKIPCTHDRGFPQEMRPASPVQGIRPATKNGAIRRGRRCNNCSSPVATGFSVPEVQYGANAGLPSFGFVSHGPWYNGPKKILLTKRVERKCKRGGRIDRSNKRSTRDCFESNPTGSGVEVGCEGSYPLNLPQ